MDSYEEASERLSTVADCTQLLLLGATVVSLFLNLPRLWAATILTSSVWQQLGSVVLMIVSVPLAESMGANTLSIRHRILAVG